MEFDCCFSIENYRFRYRSCAIIVKDDKLLFVKSNEGGYLYVIGGGVHLGETSKECVKREVYEETGLKCNEFRLSVISEIFFNEKGGVFDGFNCHNIEFYYVLNLTGNNDEIKTITDAGEELVWVDIKDIKNAFIKPVFIKEKINEMLNSNTLIHIIDEVDR